MTNQTSLAIPIVLIEEQEFLRVGLRAALAGSGIQIIKEYSSPTDFLAQQGARDIGLGTILLCSLHEKAWPNLVQTLLLQATGCPVVGIVDETTDDIATAALVHGLLGCLDRTLPPERWITVLRDISAGQASPAKTLLRRPAVARYALMMLSQPTAPPGIEALEPTLGHQERLMLANLSEEVPFNLVAERIGVSEETLQDALDSVCRKMVAKHRLSETLQRLR
ncbi:MAG: response regulator transcription factor [Chloroflexi bacterium]|nr:response regulator transcription factor [Chloroflexota bacterium]